MNPVLNQILFKPFPAAEVSASGLYIPETARETSNRGVIIKTGRGKAGKPMLLKEGTIAHRVKDWGEAIIIDNELHFLMDASAIIAVE